MNGDAFGTLRSTLGEQNGPEVERPGAPQREKALDCIKTRAPDDVLRAARESSNIEIHPLAFGRCMGWLHEADGNVGVILVSPWGYDEFCGRRSWRVLADQLAADGYPTLRFDLPGTGSSLPCPVACDEWELWLASIGQGVDQLRMLTDVHGVVLVGQGLGASLAAQAARIRHDIEGLALLAPVSDGKAFLRELQLWSRLVDGRGAAKAQKATRSIGGFSLSPELENSISKLNLFDIEGSRLPTWLASRPGRRLDARFANHLRNATHDFQEACFEGYDAMLGEPTFSATPQQTFRALGSWLHSAAPAYARRAPRLRPVSATLQHRDWVEEAVRFGEGRGLFGALTTSCTGPSSQAVIFLSTARDPHVGRGAMVRKWARALAGQGITSLRMDSAGVGDSPPRADGPEEVIFSDAQVLDVSDAIDWLRSRGFSEIWLVGRCSGAYLALQAAIRDPRVRACVLINPSRLIWDQRETVEDLIRKPLIAAGHLLTEPDGLPRRRAELLLAGFAAKVRWGVADVAKGFAGWLTCGQERDLKRTLHSNLRALCTRGTVVRIVCSEHDIWSFAQLRRFFGTGYAALRHFPNVFLRVLPGADHNLTPQSSQDDMQEILLDLLGPPSPSQAPVPHRRRAQTAQKDRRIEVVS